MWILFGGDLIDIVFVQISVSKSKLYPTMLYPGVFVVCVPVFDCWLSW